MIRIRHATLNDIDTLNKIARQYRDELGFLSKNSMQRGIDERSLLVACVDNVVVGFVLYHARRDGWQTIYDLAVDHAYHRGGIGKRLLYSVPCPVQLKCTVDNPANKFYKSIGMKYVETINGRKRRLNVWKMQYLIILHKGGATQYPRYANLLGQAYGSRSDSIAYEQPFMTDIDWNNADWQAHMSYIRKHQPVMAMCVDYERPNQRRELYKQIRDLRNAGVLRIMVCPKFHGAVAHIPSWCIIAVSIPTSHGGFMPHTDELIGRKLHLLGGNPDQHANAIYEQYPQSIVVSIDSFTAAEKAVTGQFWSKRNNWKTAPKKRFSTETLLKYSGKSIRDYLWQQPTSYCLKISSRIVRMYYRGDLFSTVAK